MQSIMASSKLLLSVFLLFAVEVLICPASASPECSKDELYHQGRCYHFKNDAGMAFEAARLYCLKRDSHMVIIDNADQNRFLLTQDHSRFGRWIGMMRTDEGSGMRFHWVADDSSPAYTNFNDAKMDFADQMCIYMDTDGRWADNTCNQPYNVMCERNPLHSSMQALQLAFNNSLGAIQHHLTMIEYMFNQLNASRPTNTSLAKTVDAMTQLVAQLKVANQQHATPTAIGPNATRGDIQLAQSMLKQLLDQTKGLSAQLVVHKNQSLPQNATTDIRTRLNSLSNLYQTFSTRLDNLTRQHTTDNNNGTGLPNAATAAAMLTDVHATLIGLLDRNRKFTMTDFQSIQQQIRDASNGMEKHFNVTVAKLQASEAQLQHAITDKLSPSVKAAALYASAAGNDNRARYAAIIHDRIPVAMMLIMLILQIFLVSVLILLGIYIRRRFKSDRSFQYNVTSAASRFSNNGQISMGRNSLAMQQTGSSANSGQQQSLYEEVGSMRNQHTRNNMPITRGGFSSAIAKDEDDGASSVASARTNSIYMSAIDAAVAELENNNNNHEPGSVTRDSGVESSAGSVLSRASSMYDPHNDRKQLVRGEPPVGHLKGGNLHK